MGSLNVGDLAPEIDAEATDGKRFVLSQQSGLCTVIFFFPKAFTPGCTTETKQFRDNFNELMLAGANVVGISTDDPSTQCNFADSLHTPFPLIADSDKRISTAYGVLWPLIGVAKRVTFVVNPQRIIDAIFRHELRVHFHRDEVLRFVHSKFEAQRRGK
jgi:peroxiredoxin